MKYPPIVEKLVIYDGKLCVEATEPRAKPYCETDWFYKAPNYTAYRYGTLHR